MYTPAITVVYDCAYHSWLCYCEEAGEPGMEEDEEQMHSYIDEYVSRWKAQATDQ